MYCRFCFQISIIIKKRREFYQQISHLFLCAANVIARMVRRFPTKPMTALIMIQTPSAIVVIVKPLSSLGKQSFEKSISGILVKQ